MFPPYVQITVDIHALPVRPRLRIQIFDQKRRRRSPGNTAIKSLKQHAWHIVKLG